MALDVYKALQEVQAIQKQHFVLSSGLHSDTYIQCARAFENGQLGLKLGIELALKVDKTLRPETRPTVVLSAAHGGTLLGFCVAHGFGARNVFAERTKEGHLDLRRGFRIKKEDRVLVVEDVVTTAGTVAELRQLVDLNQIVGFAALIDRRQDKELPLVSLLQIKAPAWKPEECELCKAKVSLEKPGSRGV